MMKKLISDRELVGYICDQLSSKEIRMLHEKAKMNGETDLLLHSQLASLACNEELANELLGEDDFMKNSIDEFPFAMAAKRFNPDNNTK